VPGNLPPVLMNAPFLLFPRDTFTWTVETRIGAGGIADGDPMLMTGLWSSSFSGLYSYSSSGS
jgi:hypothetical protein